MQAQYEFTERTLRELSREVDDTAAPGYDVMDLDEGRNNQATETPVTIATSLKDQLCDMADVLLKAFVERIGFLEL